MSREELVQQLRHLSIPDRLAVIEAATRSVYEEIVTKDPSRLDKDQRLRAAADSAKDLYRPGSEHTEWTDNAERRQP